MRLVRSSNKCNCCQASSSSSSSSISSSSSSGGGSSSSSSSSSISSSSSSSQCGDPCGTIPAAGAAGACCGVKPFVLVTQPDLEQRFPAVLCDPEFPNRLPSGPGAWFDLHDWLLSFGWIKAIPVKMRRAGTGCNIEIWGVPGGPCDNIDPFPCMSKEQSDPYPGTDFTTNLPGCCPEPVSSCVDEVGNGVKVDEWQCDELGGEFIEGKECKESPCSGDACCVTPYQIIGGNDSATEQEFPNAGAAISFCEEQAIPNPLSGCYAVPGEEGGWLWRQAVPNGESVCVPGCEDCSPPIFDENTPMEGFYKECVAGKTCNDNPCSPDPNPLP